MNAVFQNLALAIQIREAASLLRVRGRSDGAMVLGKLPVPGRPTI